MKALLAHGYASSARTMRSRRASGRRPEPPSVARAVATVAAAGLVAVILIGFGTVELLRRQSAREAVDDSKVVTRLAGRGIVAPALTLRLLAGDREAVARLDRLVRSRVLVNGIVRVKIWTSSGRIVYSDEPRLIGRRYPFTSDERAAFRSRAVRAELSNTDRPENQFERQLGKLLEVYLPIESPAGRPLLFEAYQPFNEVTASAHRLWISFAPALLGGLVLLELLQLPIAWSIARRLRQGHQERERLLRRAVDASEVERRRLARDLHDGVVQDLAGVAYAVSAAAEQVGAERAELVAGTLREATAATRRCIRQLRSLLVQIYPASLERAGLEAALSDLTAQFGSRAVEARLEFEPDLKLSSETEALLFRVAQEALRNVASHSRARQVRVSVGRDDGRVLLTVADDGRGFSPEATRRPGGDSHFGLGMLEDLVRDAGGELRIESSPGHGTRIRAGVPAR